MAFFSVLIPFHNREDMVRRAIASVCRQTDQDFELVIVDDGSTDGSVAAARDASAHISERTKLIKLKTNLGIPGARNVSLEAASGQIAAFLDSDDVCHPRFLSTVRRAFEAAPNFIFAFTNYLSLGPNSAGPVIQMAAPEAVKDPIEAMLTKPFIHTMSCFAAPLADMRALGGFNTRLKRFSDLDMYVRLLAGNGPGNKLAWKQRPFIVVPHVAVLKDIHLKDRPLQSYVAAWEANKRMFLDEVFAYPFMAKKQRLRRKCERHLDEGQRQFFANFT